MIRNLTLTLLFTILCCAPADAVIFDWADVGNPGNADDIHGDGYGGVDYAYRISKTEVTNAQYTEFLNAADSTGANSLLLYNPNMSSDARGGITFNGGAANGSKYEVKLGRDNNPVVYVSFLDAMRFVNWLENGQGSGNTESGVYSIGNGLNEVRNPNATYFIPSEDEWYKAAYYNPNAGVYYDYPTGTDTVPASGNPNTFDSTNVANFYKYDPFAIGYDDGYAVTGSTVFDNSQNYLTDVGAYGSAVSPYGTFDQGGNVWEWNEAVIAASYRGVRGGVWLNASIDLLASHRDFWQPAGETHGLGFRVASIPEPSTMLLGALTCLGVLMLRRR